MAKKQVEVEKEVVKATIHKGVHAVKFTGGNVIQTDLTWDQAQAKVDALEKQDKILKGKNWKKGFYKVIKT